MLPQPNTGPPQGVESPMAQKARCVHCRADVNVPDSYAHGDHIKCGACNTQHKVVRGDNSIRLVMADAGPLRESYQANQALVERLHAELRAAQGSLGIGANGFGLGVIYFIWQVTSGEHTPDSELAWQSVAVAVISGIALELMNFLFLAKRKKISRLHSDIREAEEEGRAIQKKLREAQRM
jgi:hypothetical protein